MLPTDDKSRKALPILTFLTEYFPDAVLEMVKVSVAGNIQHNPELAPEDIKWARGKSMDQLNTAFRHMWDHKTGTVRDSDGQYHLAKTAWRVLAELQLTIERSRPQTLTEIKQEIDKAITRETIRAAEEAARVADQHEQETFGDLGSYEVLPIEAGTVSIMKSDGPLKKIRAASVLVDGRWINVQFDRAGA